MKDCVNEYATVKIDTLLIYKQNTAINDYYKLNN